MFYTRAQAVAKFFEDNPVQQCQPCSPGSLTGIADITARRLYDKYYGGNLILVDHVSVKYIYHLTVYIYRKKSTVLFSLIC